MSDLLALLLPPSVPTQNAAASAAAVNGLALAGGLAPKAVSVQVDSSSFLSILAQTGAVNSGAAVAAENSGVITSFTNPLAELAAQSVNQGTAQPSAEQLVSSSEAVAKLDVSTVIGLQSGAAAGATGAASVQAGGNVVAEKSAAPGEKGVIIESDFGGALPEAAPAAYKALPASAQAASEQQRPVLNPNIVRAATSGSSLSASASQNPFTAVLSGSVNSGAVGEKPSILAKSSKLMEQVASGVFSDELPSAVADDPLVVEAKGTLAQANKAYQLNAGQFFGEKGQDGVLQTLAANKNFRLSPDVINPSSNNITINNLTPVPVAEVLQTHGLTNAELAKAHVTYSSPAQQASIKIAEAIDNGIKEVTIELHPSEKFGHVDIRMELSKEGVSKLIAFVEKSETLALLSKDASLLEKVLHDAGFKTDSGSLSFNLRGENGNSGNLAGGNDVGGGAGKNPSHNDIAESSEAKKVSEYRMSLDNVVDITV